MDEIKDQDGCIRQDGSERDRQGEAFAALRMIENDQVDDAVSGGVQIRSQESGGGFLRAFQHPVVIGTKIGACSFVVNIINYNFISLIPNIYSNNSRRF